MTVPYSFPVPYFGTVFTRDEGQSIAQPPVSFNYRIETVAGTGRSGFTGDGGPADQARLRRPAGVAADGVGNLFIADSLNHRIRRVNPAGTITTVAGSGRDGFNGGGFGGDGGPADQSQLDSPSGVAVDGAGNLFIADSLNHRIRRVDPAGTITTVAGTGEEGSSGDGGPADQARLDSPSGVAVDSAGNLFIVDGNYRIRRVDPTGIIITSAGGRGFGFSGDGGPADQARLAFPSGVAVDATGNLFIADAGNDRIRRVDPLGTITTVAGTQERGFGGDGGPPDQARLAFPSGVAVDGAGNLYIADWGNAVIRVLTPAVDFAHFANGASTTSDLVLVNVETVTIYPTLYFYDATGAPLDAESVVVVRGDLETAVDKGLTVTMGIEPLGERTISTHGEGDLVTGSVTVLSSGRGGGVLRFDLPEIGVAGVGASPPVSGAIFPARRQADGINTGAAIRNLGLEAMTVTCHLMQDGNVLETTAIWLAGSGQVARFIDEWFPETETSDFVGSVRCIASGDGGPADEARLAFPSSVAVDSAGSLFIVDEANHRIRRVDPAGIITTVAGTGERGSSGDEGPADQARLAFPTGVAIDGAGNLFIADRGNHRIRKVDPAGTITTFAGTGRFGVLSSDRSYYFRGDGGPADQAALFSPRDVSVDGTGNLFIADTGNDRIRRVEQTGTITTFAGTAPEGELFTGVALELDADNRIFTTLPVVPVPPPGTEGQATTLDFAHFGNGSSGNGASITSDLVLVNVSARPVRPELYFFDPMGAALDAESVVDVTGYLQVQEDGALSVQTEMAPLGELTISTHGRGALVTGSVKVVAEGPIGGVLRFALPEIGVAGVGASSPVRDTIFPVRRQAGGIRTGAAIHSLGETGVEVTCSLMQAGTVLEEAEIPLEANGQTAWFIEEMFVRTETSDFLGSVRCTAPDGQLFTGVALELDAVNRIFTTLPMVPIQR